MTSDGDMAEAGDYSLAVCFRSSPPGIERRACPEQSQIYQSEHEIGCFFPMLGWAVRVELERISLDLPGFSR